MNRTWILRLKSQQTNKVIFASDDTHEELKSPTWSSGEMKVVPNATMTITRDVWESRGKPMFVEVQASDG